MAHTIIIIPMRPEQFAKVEDLLKSSKDVRSFELTSPTTGTVTTSQLDFTFDYDGTANMSIELGARHTWESKLASDGAIKAHLEAMLAQVA